MSSTATVARSNAFLTNMLLIDDLERYALAAGPAVDPQRLPGATARQQQALKTEQGGLAVYDWLTAYKQSIDLLRRFRAALTDDPAGATDDDLREVSEGSARVLRGLLRRLEN